MPIDLDKVLGTVLADTTHAWDEDDVILYHLGIGAGVPPTDPRELRYVYEADLQVLPSFATIPMFTSMMGVLNVDGLDLNPALILHGGHDVELHRPLPTAATVTNHATIINVFDKGKAAVLVIEIVSVDRAGEALFTNTASLFLRGEGGFGGPSGPDPTHAAPSRPPDHVSESRTLPQQALLYRLSGDKNPLHADPGFAAFGGFDRPILHGLCSFGLVCKALVDAAADGEAARVRRFGARFTGVVFPGESVRTSMWRDGEGWIVEATTVERGTPVLANSAAEMVVAP